MVRCPKSSCREVFNALTTIRDERQSQGAEEVGQQLRVVQLGDRILIDPKVIARPRPAADTVSAATTRSPDAAAVPSRRLSDTPGDFETSPQRPEAPARAASPSPQPQNESPAAQPVPETTSASGSALASRQPSAWARLADLSASFANFSLAVRNLLRHRRRSALGLSAVAFGVIALLLASGFIEWMYWENRESTIRARLGHIQIVKSDFFEKGFSDPFSYLLPPDTPELQRVLESAHVSMVASRLSFSGLISFGDNTVSFIGEGVEPNKEKVVSGNLRVVEGEVLSEDDPDGVILGAGLAMNLGISVGDTAILVAKKETGSISAVEVRVKGIFRTVTKAFDDSALRVPLPTARRLLETDGSHAWVVLLDETENTPAVTTELRNALGASNLGLDIVPWFDLADFYAKFVTLFSRQVNVVRAIIVLVILISISNTLIMSVVERTAEIGTLLAVGLRRRVVLKLFVFEGCLLGIGGALLGLILGVLLSLIISRIGIPMPPPPNMEIGFTGEIMLTWPLVVITTSLAVGATALASFYPAWKASRL
ncbi:MAG: FtsX-like permease family protein, partial [Gammaproteobacteria bacterium]|nr:FtsX-like permease family protein [Gammaproteobacteria bacterium]